MLANMIYNQSNIKEAVKYMIFNDIELSFFGKGIKLN